MTYQEKAKELLDFYQRTIFDMVDMSQCEGYHSTTIECAVRAVDEILSLEMVFNMGRDDDYNEGTFYEKVKEEMMSYL